MEPASAIAHFHQCLWAVFAISICRALKHKRNAEAGLGITVSSYDKKTLNTSLTQQFLEKALYDT